MSKQIKIGLDKVPAPVTKQFTQLVDIEGTKLFDAAGNPLVTEEEAALTQFTSSQSSLSVYVNNTDLSVIPIEEQFPDTSAVSSSLLGVPRSEEQLALFSDVATYGLDEEQWNEYTFSNNNTPREWYRKKNPIYGRRSRPSFNEGSTEQALYLKAFPSQYTFPRGPIARRAQDPSPGFISYMNFIALGKFLYNIFKTVNLDFAEKFLLNDDFVYVVDSSGTPVDYVFLTNTSEPVFEKNSSWHDVEYSNPIQDSFDAIERWTFFFDQIKSDVAKFPLMINSGEQDYTRTLQYRKIVSFAVDACVPGGTSKSAQIAVLESKKAFRYQPGRASGFTFGSRMATDPNSIDTILEWGCSNETDEYMFQLRGSQFNIIRRSTIRMPDELLVRQGLTAEDQSSTAVFPSSIGNSNALWETVISRSKWNGDALLGAGESGYILSFEDVTMYKIEFSWYGAIGAKFYAYIPVGNGDARWVKLHTFVIENGLGQPVLANPDFKFKYLLNSLDNANIKSPIYLYKYGSSYYVDGGDEGTIRLSTTTSPTKQFTNRTPILGVLPKDYIVNSQGDPIRNYKKSYPSNVSVSSDRACRIDVEEINGSSQGAHFNFSPSIVMDGRHPKSRTLDFQFFGDSQLNILQPTDTSVQGTIEVTQGEAAVTGTNTAFTTDLVIGDNISISGVDYQVEAISSITALTLTVVYAGDSADTLIVTVVKRLNPSDDNARIISDGIYGTYVNPAYDASTGRTTNVLRRSSDYALTTNSVLKYRKTNGSILNPSDNPTFSGVLSNYNTIVASSVGIAANNFKIHFLNPRAVDPSHLGYHFAEFAISLSPYPPVAPGGDADDNKVQFEYAANQFKDFDLKEFPYVEYCHQGVAYSYSSRAEVYEWDPSYGDQMQIDPRLPEPDGINDPLTNVEITGSNGEISFDNQAVVVGDEITISGTVSGAEGVIPGSRFRVSVTNGSTTATLTTTSRTAISTTPATGNAKIGSINESTSISLKGKDSGYQSTIVGKVTTIDYQVAAIEEGIGTYNGKFKVTFATNVSGPAASLIKFDSSNQGTSEVGTLFAGTGKFFESVVTVPPGGGNAYVYVSGGNGTTGKPIAEDLGAGTGAAFVADPDNPKFIQTKILELSSDWQAISYDEDGVERFTDNKFVKSQAITFSAQPLYPVFALGDYAKVNCVVIEETDGSGLVKTHTPVFVTEESSYNQNITILNSGGSNSSETPCAFNSNEQLASCRYDTSALNPLRPGSLLYSFYVDANKPVLMDLKSIFDVDRKGVSRGLLNNKAIYFTATSLDGNQGNVEATLTIKEQ